MSTRCCVLPVMLLLCSATSLRAQLVGVEFDSGTFYSIDAADGSLQVIADTDITQIGALEWNPMDGFVYGFTTGAAAALYRFTISPTMDEVTAQLIGPMGLFVSEGGLAFSPNGTAYAFNLAATTPYLMSVNLQTGAATPLLQFDDRYDISGLGWRNDGMLIGLDSTANQLIAIDPADLATTLIEDLPQVGSIGGIAHGALGSFLITAGPENPIAGTNSLYSFDPLAGDLMLIANYEDQILGSGFSGLTFIPEPSTLLLVVGGALLIRRRPL